MIFANSIKLHSALSRVMISARRIVSSDIFSYACGHCHPGITLKSAHHSNLLAAHSNLRGIPMTHLPGNRMDAVACMKGITADDCRRHSHFSRGFMESSKQQAGSRISSTCISVCTRFSLSSPASNLAVDAEPPAEKVARRGRGVNERKRNAKQAKDFAEELIELSPKELKSVAKWVGLHEDTVEAIRLAKTLIPSKVKNGWRRQLSYIGGLLRHLDSTLLPAAIKAAKEGSGAHFHPALHMSESADFPLTEDELRDWPQEGTEEEEVESGSASDELLLAQRWMDGLLAADSSVGEEVYALDDPSFDRQELRKLVRNALIEIGAQQDAASRVGSQLKEVVGEGGSEEDGDDGVPIVPQPLLIKESRRDQQVLKTFLSNLAGRTIEARL